MTYLRNEGARVITPEFAAAYKHHIKKEAGNLTKQRPLSGVAPEEYHEALKALGIESQTDMVKLLDIAKDTAAKAYKDPSSITPYIYGKLVDLRGSIFCALLDDDSSDIATFNEVTAMFIAPTDDMELCEGARAELLNRCLVDGFKELSDQHKQALLGLLAEWLKLDGGSSTTTDSIEQQLRIWQNADIWHLTHMSRYLSEQIRKEPSGIDDKTYNLVLEDGEVISYVKLHKEALAEYTSEREE